MAVAAGPHVGVAPGVPDGTGVEVPIGVGVPVPAEGVGVDGSPSITRHGFLTSTS